MEGAHWILTWIFWDFCCYISSFHFLIILQAAVWETLENSGLNGYDLGCMYYSGGVVANVDDCKVWCLATTNCVAVVDCYGASPPKCCPKYYTRWYSTLQVIYNYDYHELSKTGKAWLSTAASFVTQINQDKGMHK